MRRILIFLIAIAIVLNLNYSFAAPNKGNIHLKEKEDLGEPGNDPKYEDKRRKRRN